MRRVDAIKWVEHQSQVLKGNPLSDPSKRAFPVYVPPSYHHNAQNRYPVLFYLSGWGSVGASILDQKAPFALSLVDMLDQWFEGHPEQECVIVFPDASIRWGCSQYINSSGTGRYMDYLCDELVAFVESEFHVLTSPAMRGLFGHSSGGFGAMATGMLRPEVFGHILSSAGDSHYAHLYTSLVPAFIRTVEKYKGIEKLAAHFINQTNPLRNSPREVGHSMLLLNMCMCFLPNPQAPLGADLFFDLTTGELSKEQWQKFLAWDPVFMVDDHMEALRSLSSFALFAGWNDEYGIHLGHRQIRNKLQKAGVAHAFVEYDEGHSGTYHRTLDHVQHLLEQMPLKQA